MANVEQLLVKLVLAVYSSLSSLCSKVINSEIVEPRSLKS